LKRREGEKERRREGEKERRREGKDMVMEILRLYFIILIINPLASR
jgi:hypothetical protein